MLVAQTAIRFPSLDLTYTRESAAAAGVGNYRVDSDQIAPIARIRRGGLRAGGRSPPSTIALSRVQRGARPDECMSCGPFETGVCVSSSVCCLPLTGCRSSPAVAARCQLENASPRPCALRGRACGTPIRPGICVVNGVCCTGGSIRRVPYYSLNSTGPFSA